MDPQLRRREAELAARQAQLARRERLVAAREGELRRCWPFRALWLALRLAPLTLLELIISAGLLAGVVTAPGGASSDGAVAAGAAVLIVLCVARLIGADRPQ